MAEFFSTNLKKLREEKGLSQNKLAEKIGVNQTTIARWEDDNRVPTIDNAIDVAEALNVSLPDLLGKDLRLEEIKKDQIDDDLSVLDNVLYTHKDKIDSARNLPIEKQQAIANAVKSVLDMIDDNNSNQ